MSSSLCGGLVWASCQIRKNTGCACAGNAGNVFPRRQFQRKLLYSDPGMHHGTCVTHVPWCMSGSLTCGDGENVPGIPGACATAILRIWQEAHGTVDKPLPGSIMVLLNDACYIPMYCHHSPRIALHGYRINAFHDYFTGDKSAKISSGNPGPVSI